MPSDVRSVDNNGSLHLLVVDPDHAVRGACCEIAAGLGYAVQDAPSIAAALKLLRGRAHDILLLDMEEPGGEALELLDEAKILDPDLGIVVMTAFASVAAAVEAMRTGASDYLAKPFGAAELAMVLERISERRRSNLSNRRLRDRLRSPQGLGNLIGRSGEMEKLYRILSKAAQSTHPVLILGESGVGKELVARAIHANGPAVGRPFVPIDCGSLAPTLIESELFGYVKGAFTGAVRSRTGLLASAQGGTVLLDEIGELPLDLQSKLLRVLQEKEVRPLGSTECIALNVRVLASTNRDLAAMVAQDKFRKDLYYRLNVVSMRIPPLRDRREDIPLLAAHFLDRMARETGVAHTLSDDALRTIMEYDWPGNVRELENAVDRACALSSGPVLHLGDLPTQLQNFRLQRRRAEHPVPASAAGNPPAREVAVQPLAEMERIAIVETLRKLKGDKLQTARLLGIGKTTLYRKLKEYGIADAGPEGAE